MQVPEISVQEAEERLKSPQAPRLVDVREEDEWEICHIEGAELVPLSRFPELALELIQDREESLLIYCHHGMRSAHAAAYLLQQGFMKVTNLAGGIDAWAREIDPTLAVY